VVDRRSTIKDRIAAVVLVVDMIVDDQDRIIIGYVWFLYILVAGLYNYDIHCVNIIAPVTWGESPTSRFIYLLPQLGSILELGAVCTQLIPKRPIRMSPVS